MASLSVAASVSAVSLCAPAAVFPGVSKSLSVRFHAVLAPSVGPLFYKRPCRIVAMASPPSKSDDLVDKVRESIASAQEVCVGNETSEECVVAWDEVEELSAAAADKRVKLSPSGYTDPLEKYCEDHPETDECRVYED